MHKILIIDDDTYICKLLDNYLSKNGYQTDSAYTGTSAIKKIKKNAYDLVLCDYRLPDSNGEKILNQAKSKDPFIPVIIITAYQDLSDAVRLIKLGAHDYLAKPVIPEEILERIRDAFSREGFQDTSISFSKDFIPGKSKKFREVLDHIRIVAPVEMSVVIEGETGSGKEYVARAIHYSSKRREGPFIAVDCGALPKGLVNSELFGHIKGSFTGATFDKRGLFEQAHGGTLFLDEIANLDAENQMKLLRVLQERTITRIGDTRTIKVDVRLVVASNEDLIHEVEKNRIRQDLYHRLNEFKISIPPLRERGEDILIFAWEFIKRASKRFNKNALEMGPEMRDVLLNYSWPGNVRELKNVMTRAVLLADSEQIGMKELPDEVRFHQTMVENGGVLTGGKESEVKLKSAAERAEKETIVKALIKSNYNKSRAARLLKIDRKTLYNKIKQLDIRFGDS